MHPLLLLLLLLLLPPHGGANPMGGEPRPGATHPPTDAIAAFGDHHHPLGADGRAVEHEVSEGPLGVVDRIGAVLPASLDGVLRRECGRGHPNAQVWPLYRRDDRGTPRTARGPSRPYVVNFRRP